jgi:phosphohistidine phosphatase
MELLILCAGAGDKRFEGNARDRPLRTKGKRQAQKIGAYLGRERLRPEIVLVAPGERSKATAQKALKAAGWTARNIGKICDLSPEALATLPRDRRVLLVAPSGAVETLANRLCVDADPAPGVLLQLSFHPEGTRLRASIDPNDLSDLFPYPSPDGPERRERPAYYYTQSAVIPFRRTARGTEIMITGSSSGRHWVVPKGIVEPGLGPAASAEVEAREEAGVEGKVSDTPLGTFTYEKWGATCEVQVFAMEVSREIPDAEWEESHRQRKWVCQAEASALLYQPAFQQLVREV